MREPVLVFLLLGGIAVHPPRATPQSTGTFRPTGNMTVARAGHSATLLPDGKVLIAGGFREIAFGGFEIILATAELYDPSSGAFVATANLGAARAAHTATLLPDGKVLIAGGLAGRPENLLKSAELYDPSTATFTATGDMVAAQRCQGATLLDSGKVLITGGTAADAELYDPTTGRFSPAGTYAARSGDFNTCQAAVSTLLPDGRVLLVWEDGNAEVYDPDTGVFAATGADGLGRNDGLPTATLLTTGRVLVAGGAWDGDLSPIETRLYDPSTGTFEIHGDMIWGHVHHTATLLPDGTVLMAGGWLFPGVIALAEIYLPGPGSFFGTWSMITPRGGGQTATLLNTGEVLVTGGVAGSGVSGLPDISSNAEVYHPVVLVPAPRLASLRGDGPGQGAIWRAATGELASPSSPAIAGEVLSMYTTSLVDGGRIPPQVAIGGQLAEILYFGAAPGYSGYFQVNLRMPAGVAPGPAVPVRLTYIGRSSNEVTIGVR